MRVKFESKPAPFKDNVSGKLPPFIFILAEPEIVNGIFVKSSGNWMVAFLFEIMFKTAFSLSLLNVIVLSSSVFSTVTFLLVST